MGISSNLASDLYKTDRLTDNDKEALKKLIIDFFAAAYAGYKQNKSFADKVESVIFAEASQGSSSVMFRSGKYSARTAAFMNSLYGHGAELDDGNKQAAGHAGVHIIPAVFALADKQTSSNDDVLVALATGYEAYIRISSAAQPGLVKRGFHSTGMAGTLACAAACARLYHLDAFGIENAIALSTTMTGGLLSYGDSRPAIKPLNPAKAAENGLLAACLANEGILGPSEALEGPNGWFHAVTDEIHEEYLGGKDHLLLHDCYFKLYPSCRHTHCGIDAAVSLHKRIDVNAVKTVNIYIYPNAIKLAGIKYPKDRDETKFSIQYTLACALKNGSYGIADMDISNMSEDIVSLIDKTTLIPDSSMENREKGIRGTRVEVILDSGERVEETVTVPKGDPENPLTKEDIIEKLKVCSKGMADSEQLDELVAAVQRIDGSGAFCDPITLIGEVR